MTARVVFATAPADYLGTADTDRALHETACAEVGIDLAHAVWSDPGVPWDEYDLVVVRSTWDYPEHLAEFRTWLGRLGGLGP